MPVRPENLCLSCGLCCDGTIFGDVKLSGLEQSKLKQLTTERPGLFNLGRSQKALRQPCPAFVEGQCAIYQQRPGHCRKFDCALLQLTLAGGTDPAAAARIIKVAKRKADKVRHLLREAGNEEEHLALMTRYKRTLRKFEQEGCPENLRHVLADLSIAVHELTTMLSKHFYP